MPTVSNKTLRPLSVPLPGGKKLRLGPLKSGQVQPKAIEHPPLLKLVEAGELEIEEQSARGSKAQGPSSNPSTNPNRSSTGGIRHTGDR